MSDRIENGSARSTIAALLLAVMTFLLYTPVMFNDFVLYDDPEYVFENGRILQGLSWSNIGWAFRATTGNNWHPVTLLSHMFDITVFGLDAGAHHAVSAFFHSLNAALLFLFFCRTTTCFWKSAVVAALFAWHPLHVESVAWASERKDVLSTFFLILTLLSYQRYTTATGRKRAGLYVVCLTLYAVGLLSKPMLVTTPFVLLLLDYWPLHRIAAPSGDLITWIRNHRRLLIEKAPFLVLALVASVVTVYAQGEAIKSAELFPFVGRVQNAIISYVLYLWKMMYPVNLAVYYPHPKVWPQLAVVGAATVFLFITGAVVISAERRPYLFTGWFWYVGTLVPVIGLVQVGSASMADRYTYIPLIGIFAALVWRIAALVEHRAKPVKNATVVGCVTILAASGFLTSRQIRYWQSSETLFRHAAAVTNENILAWFNLGVSLFGEDRLDESLHYFNEVLKRYPDDADSLRFVGQILCKKGKAEEGAKRLLEAESIYHQRIANNPHDTDSIQNAAFVQMSLGLALAMQKRYPEAITSYRKAIELSPADPIAYNELAWILATNPDPKLRNGKEAVHLATRACELTEWKRTAFVGTLDAAFAEAGDFEQAIVTAKKTIDSAEQQHQSYLADLAWKRLALYRQKKPFHQ